MTVTDAMVKQWVEKVVNKYPQKNFSLTMFAEGWIVKAAQFNSLEEFMEYMKTDNEYRKYLAQAAWEILWVTKTKLYKALK